jgi:hypothetical protein
MQLDFPVFSSGEIDGTVYLVSDDRTVPAGRVKVEAVDDNGHVVAWTTTEYDGFYIISNVPLGQYHVRVSAEQLAELGLQSDDEPLVVISADDQFESGIDFNLSDKKDHEGSAGQ